ncbi:hypothetical protein SVIOM74S_07626 [Streptomyces violarus]
MRNSNDPETSRMAERVGALCIGERVYTSCDLVGASANSRSSTVFVLA